MSHTLFPEYALRELWQRQQFSRERLRTADGRPVTVLSPGTPNDDGGPDFTGARIRIGGTIYVGDVELHIDAAAWQEHRHAADPHYNGVILHVALTANPLSPPARTASRRTLPLLVLQPYLGTGSLLEGESIEPPANRRALPCRTRTDGISSAALGTCLDRLAAERMDGKVCRFGERLKQLADERTHAVYEPYPRYYGRPEEIPPPGRSHRRGDLAAQPLWDQLLYEAIMEALGYDKNQEPFLRLAHAVPLQALRAHGLDDATPIMALLFGVAGLLPSSRRCTDPEARRYLRALRRRWREMQASYRGPRLYEGDWFFFRLRPANFPTARLASLCFLLPVLFNNGGFIQVVNAFREHSGPLHALRRLCAAAADEFWSRHYHFQSATRRRTSGLGRSRIDQIILNTFIPCALLYARTFGDDPLHAAALGLLAALPPLQEDRIVRLVRRRVNIDQSVFNSAQRQQGALQLYGNYCVRKRCEECPVGRRNE